MMRKLVYLFLLLLPLPALAVEMVMVEEQGCAYCRKWNAEIAPIYPKTKMGEIAPLSRVEKADVEDKVAILRPVIFTPTFLFIEDGKEFARLEGYQSQDFFWALGEEIIAEHEEKQ